jgi:hypothetical protein
MQDYLDPLDEKKREELYLALQKKMEDQERLRQSALGDRADRMASDRANNAFLEVLSKASSKAGTIDGKEAGSSLDGYSNKIAEADTQAFEGMKANQAGQSATDLKRLELAKYLDEKRTDRSFKSRQQSEVERHNKAGEGERKAKEKEADKPRPYKYFDKDGNERSGKEVNGNILMSETDPIIKPAGLDKKDPPVDKALAKQDTETNYRYNSLVQNAEELKELVRKHGTVNTFGDVGAKMDSKIYQMAVDYAKMVDPDSVAREGEVAAAQKYMLPFRNSGGLTTRNATAIKQIENYISDLNNRVEARNLAKQGERVVPKNNKEEGFSLEDKAVASPALPPPPKGKIRVKSPNGEVGFIPVEDLKDALNEGYQEIK